MFIRVKTSKNSPKKAVQIVESYRTADGKVRQRIVRHIGTALDEQELTNLKNLAEYAKAELETEKAPSLFKPEQMAEMAIDAREDSSKKDRLAVNLKNIVEENRISVGVQEAFGCIYKELGFKHLLGTDKPTASRNLRHTVLARIANPKSKRASVLDMAKDFGINISLDSIYRMMDLIDEDVISKANKLAYRSAKKLLGDEISILFYDCTTLYFESFSEDELKRNGYSKDMKFNQVQVLVGLLITSQGLPIGYEVFSGNEYEGATLEVIIPKLIERYNIKRVIFTADSAMLSKKNIAYLEQSGLEYIVAARLKSLAAEWKDKITQRDNNSNIRSFDYGQGRRLIVTYSRKLAEKNKHDRDKALAKLRKKLSRSNNPASLISNYGYKRYLRITGNSKVVIDEDRYAESAMFDGLHGVITNVKDLSDNEIIEHYHSLWQIEDCFRISKHDLKIRPVYHWTPKRIRAHILICFLALTCVRHLSYRVKLRYESMSAGRMINALNHIQLSILYDKKTQKRYVIPSKFSDDARKIYKTLDLPINTTPYLLKQADK